MLDYGIKGCKSILRMNLSYMLCWMIPIDLKIILKIGIHMYQDMWKVLDYWIEIKDCKCL